MKRAIAASLLAAAIPAVAFKLQAPGTSAVDRVLGAATPQAEGFLAQFRSDVHERITQRAYDMAGEKLPADVVAGVRWNDNPPALRLSALAGGCGTMAAREGLDCWTSLLRVDRTAMEIMSRRQNTIPPIRSHFGDMQFLHAMGAQAGESAGETREKALRWAEFAYRVARGEVGARANVHDLRNARTPLDPATSAWLGDLFRAPAKKHWTVQDIFLARGGKLKSVAFGSLLHLVEDSYSAAHVQRVSARVQPNGCPSYDAADAIVEFHTYAGQDTEKHGLCDDAPDWLESPRAGSPIDPLAAIIRAYRDGQDWSAVRRILEEQVFPLAATTSPASIGRCFALDVDASLAAGGTPVHPTALDASCRQ